MSHAPTRTVLPWIVILLCTFVVAAVAVGGAFVASIWFVAASPQPQPEPVEPPAPPKEDVSPVATISAIELWNVYGKDAADADAKYKGKFVRITGNVAAVARDEGGLFVGVQVATGTALNLDELKKRPERERRWHKNGFPPNVVCYAAVGSEAPLTAFRPGDRVELIGIVVGRKKADVWRDYVVLLESCRAAGPGKE
jgi:hypothetical protein